jgi:mRNA deadenylase 3'-5' endonuclease subunit Ccr4
LIDYRLIKFDDVYGTLSKEMIHITDNLAQLGLFRLRKYPEYLFIMSNCHLYWRPTHNYVKLLQMCYLLEKVTIYQREFCNLSNEIPIVACGGKELVLQRKHYLSINKNVFFF